MRSMPKWRIIWAGAVILSFAGVSGPSGAAAGPFGPSDRSESLLGLHLCRQHGRAGELRRDQGPHRRPVRQAEPGLPGPGARDARQDHEGRGAVRRRRPRSRHPRPSRSFRRGPGRPLPGSLSRSRPPRSGGRGRGHAPGGGGLAEHRAPRHRDRPRGRRKTRPETSKGISCHGLPHASQRRPGRPDEPHVSLRDRRPARLARGRPEWKVRDLPELSGSRTPGSTWPSSTTGTPSSPTAPVFSKRTSRPATSPSAICPSGSRATRPARSIWFGTFTRIYSSCCPACRPRLLERSRRRSNTDDPAADKAGRYLSG
ncbi:MAG: hypothetical protein MZU95_06625 [Desulfomicrobium escambiense]|nr:hypothetical protein [Desulfomicrobium escambiense]